MEYFNIPLFILLLSATYLCVVYLGLGWVKRVSLARRRENKPIGMDSTKTVRPS
ncbi:MAG: hypothetical protein WBB82_13015 [Limnothrix sp.]